MSKKISSIRQTSGFHVACKAEDKSAEIHIYGAIGEPSWFDPDVVSQKAVSDELDKLPKDLKNLTIRLNSVGGDVFQGIGIYNRLKQFKAHKTVIVEGIAASIASIIMCCGDTIKIGTGAMVMVHLPMGGKYGNRVEQEKFFDILLTVEEQLLDIYKKRMKNTSRNEIRKALEDETWYGADEAIEAGLCDKKLEDTVAIAACLVANAKFKKVPNNIYTDQVSARKRADELVNKFQGYTARK